MKGRSVTLSADSRGSVRLFTLCVSSILVFLLTCPVFAVEKKGVSEPTLSSIFPLGGQRGTTVEVEFRGKLIAGAYAVWPKSDGLETEIKSVEEVEGPPSGGMEAAAPPADGEARKLPYYRVLVQLDIGPSVPVGMHRLRLVSPAGVSNPMEFQVVDHPVVIEGSDPHQAAFQGQPTNLPVVIHGRLADPGEVDYYSFSAAEGQELSFKIARTQGFDARLALYQPKGSWLDPNRPRRLLLDEDRSSDMMRGKSEGTYRVVQTGQYAVEVSSLFGKGSPDSAYELQVFADDKPPLSKEENERHWSAAGGSSFGRKVGADWMGALQSRAAEKTEKPPSPSDSESAVAGGTVSAPGKETIEASAVSSEPIYLSETEPNDRTGGALPISVPTVIEGAIARPGDIDIFRFRAEPGQRLAFEIETPEEKPPHFNPRISVVDSEDHELFTNLYRRRSLYNNNADEQVYFKSVRPKVIYSFKGGEYFLQVRDVTTRYGDSRYAYRLLVRPQIPHVGEVSLEKGSSHFDGGGKTPDRIDRINLVRGQARKLTIYTPHEEGFTGDVSFSVSGLPPGVEALAAAEVNDETAPTEIPVDPELILPKMQETTIVLLAGEDAPLTRMPATIRLQCRPIVDGKPGSTLPVRDLPLMVVEEPENTKRETAAL